MKTVLYTASMEPITVINLPTSIYVALRQLKYIPPFRVPVFEPLDWSAYSQDKQGDWIPNLRTVEIQVTYVPIGNVRTPIFTTREEESALLLEALFLPGQQKEVNAVRQEAIAKGFEYAITKLIKLLNKDET